VTVHTIAATTHGRFLVEPSSAAAGRLRVLVGFHGYAEDAEAQLERLKSIPGAERWTRVSIQALHPFYQRRTSRVVASWMTRQDRDLAIADNIAYVAAVLDQILPADHDGLDVRPLLVFAGFSQGVAIAYRAACRLAREVGGVVGFGGDVPPELDDALLARIPAALVGRGIRDDVYAPAVRASDERRLNAAGVRVQAISTDAGHEWTPEFAEAAARFLTGLE
jgi:predicted esterase